MTSYSAAPPPAPKKTLTWLAIASFVVGVVLTGFFVWRIVATAPKSPTPVDGGVHVKLEKEGLTIYSSVPVLLPPCEVKDAHDADIPLRSPKGSEQISIGGETWYVVARSVSAVPPGDYVVNCEDSETNATYAVGPRSGVTAFVLSIFGAIGSFLIFLILGGILLGVGIVKNRRRNRPGNTFPTQGPGNYPPAPGAPGNYPPPGNTFPTQPYNPGPNPDRPS
ncbi:hypothetical protein EV646_106128 [Kribbella antiqua]|uniref:Uncharacterized protein n=1 Tax=Kribbella antiqua TaxID=2512217 RepID=A0A4R2IRV7_9ACTN|nr:hypothetical protein [Kribbella antiqua]TCO46889.1 hypothetical protein EV646_106128 [Kribbella antiqua]